MAVRIWRNSKCCVTEKKFKRNMLRYMSLAVLSVAALDLESQEVDDVED